MRQTHSDPVKVAIACSHPYVLERTSHEMVVVEGQEGKRICERICQQLSIGTGNRHIWPEYYGIARNRDFVSHSPPTPLDQQP